jgi:hypothetical protein
MELNPAQSFFSLLPIPDFAATSCLFALLFGLSFFAVKSMGMEWLHALPMVSIPMAISSDPINDYLVVFRNLSIGWLTLLIWGVAIVTGLMVALRLEAVSRRARRLT